MKNIIIKNIMNSIKKKYNYNKTKLLEIQYGLESLYLLISKTIVIFSLSLILGVFKEMLYLLIFYSILRTTGFGVHAKKSWHCWSSSIIIFIGIPFITKYILIPRIVSIILCILCVVSISIYAPADTENRPIIDRKRRITYKLITVIISLIYSFIIIFTNYHLNLYILLGMILESIMILPITYKLFDVSYNNYKNYKKSLSK